VIILVEQGHLSAGHARTLLALPGEREMHALAQEIVAKGMSVREAEQRTKQSPVSANPGQSSTSAKPTGSSTITRSHESYARAAEEELRRYLQTDVQIALSSADRGTLK